MAKTRILIASPIHQKPVILQQFLQSLNRLQLLDFEYSFAFVDDNEDPQSCELLAEFQNQNDQVSLIPSRHEIEYITDERTHYWNESLVWHVAAIKNTIIDYATELAYDYLFLVDSDILLHPHTLNHLVSLRKDIISEIFWTRWQPEAGEQPQVWLSDEYTQWRQDRGEKLSDQEKSLRYQAFLEQLRIPGVYEVGGLGACTLISKKALQRGVNFRQIPNLSFWGEDRHFCIRAAALGLQLYVDTHYPAYHIYRESDLDSVPAFIASGLAVHEMISYSGSSSSSLYLPAAKAKLTLTMIVRNESGRYLRKVIEEHRKYVDEVVIIDDGSTDDTVDICLNCFTGIPVHLVRNTQSKFANEVELRKQQWHETIGTNPEWILNLDADEMFENRFIKELPQLLNQMHTDAYCFRLYDFWNEDHYREDENWCAHKTYRPFLVRYRPNFEYTWKKTPQHCGRFPSNIFQLPNSLSDLRLKHFGWMRQEDRNRKYNRYMEFDPNGEYGSLQQYLTICNEHPHLVPWIE